MKCRELRALDDEAPEQGKGEQRDQEELATRISGAKDQTGADGYDHVGRRG